MLAPHVMGGQSTYHCHRPARGALCLWWQRTNNNHNRSTHNNNVKGKRNNSYNSNNSNNSHNISISIINAPHNLIINNRLSHSGSWRSGYSHHFSAKEANNTPRCPRPRQGWDQAPGWNSNTPPNSNSNQRRAGNGGRATNGKASNETRLTSRSSPPIGGGQGKTAVARGGARVGSREGTGSPVAL